MSYLNLYKNNPTAGGTDGSKVVTGNPVITPYLDLAANETAIIKLALRSDTFYATLQPTVITPTAPATTLAVEAAIGATTISVVSATGLKVGNRIDIGTGGTLETKRITAIDGTTLRVDSALVNVQASGAAVVCRSKYQIALAPDNAGEPGTFGDWGEALTITDTIDDTNTIIWAQVRALAAEAVPYNDTSAGLSIAYKVGEV
ncbi:MAG: hypothetical protein AB9917_13630 [Negativicutes bacterium]